MSDLITIDSSQGEGGGQVLRSAIGLAMVVGRPVRIENVRARRDPPGLKRQHLTAVLAAAKLCGARVEGATLGSQQVSVWPGPVRGSEFRFDVGTAGSTTLVLQTLLPALLTTRSCPGPVSVTVIGGTHNPMAPPAPFIERVFLPLLRRMGAQVGFVCERPGFYPRGGGVVRLDVTPVESLRPIALLERGRVIRREATAAVAGLPPEIAQREAGVVRRALAWPEECVSAQELPAAFGPGNFVTVEIGCEHAAELFTAIGARGKRAEAVAKEAANAAKDWVAQDVPVGPHLADQLLIPMALSGGGSFITGPLDLHTPTNAAVVEQVLGVRTSVEEAGGGRVSVVVGQGAG